MYSPPVVYVNGAIVAAADLEANVEALNDYVNEGIVATDMEMTNWCEARHICRPRFESVVNRFDAPTGMVEHHNLQLPEGLGMAGAPPIASYAATFHMGKAGLAQVDVEVDARVPNDGDGAGTTSYTKAYLFIDGVQQNFCPVWAIEENAAGFASREVRHFWHVHWTGSLTSGTHLIELRCGGSTALVSYGVRGYLTIRGHYVL